MTQSRGYPGRSFPVPHLLLLKDLQKRWRAFGGQFPISQLFTSHMESSAFSISDSATSLSSKSQLKKAAFIGIRLVRTDKEYAQ